MAPVEGLGVVGEIEAHEVEVEFYHRHAKDVTAAEGAKIDSVLRPGDPAELGVEVVEEHLGVFGDTVAEEREEEVHIGAATGQHEGKFVFDDGAFHLDARSDEADGEIAGIVVVVAIAGADIEH